MTTTQVKQLSHHPPASNIHEWLRLQEALPRSRKWELNPSISEVARRLSVSRKTVTNYIPRYKAGRLNPALAKRFEAAVSGQEVPEDKRTRADIVRRMFMTWVRECAAVGDEPGHRQLSPPIGEVAQRLGIEDKELREICKTYKQQTVWKQVNLRDALLDQDLTFPFKYITACANCFAPFSQPTKSGHRAQHFCSAKCRNQYHNMKKKPGMSRCGGCHALVQGRSISKRCSSLCATRQNRPRRPGATFKLENNQVIPEELEMLIWDQLPHWAQIEGVYENAYDFACRKALDLVVSMQQFRSIDLDTPSLAEIKLIDDKWGKIRATL